ncbi:MAG: hypothetical protein AB1305_03945 [Candidatus Hadarchaeota archaeon]
MTPLKHEKKTDRRIFAPILVLVLLSIPLALALASGGLPIGAEFSGETLVKASQVQQVLVAAIAAVVTAGILSLVAFRSQVAGWAVPLVIGADTLEVLGLMALLNIQVTLASLAAILAVLIYALDSNALVAHRLLAGTGGTAKDQIRKTLKSGLMMGGTTALMLLLVFALSMSVQVLPALLVLLAGVGLNVLNTWFLGAEILAMYGKRKMEVEHHAAL